MTERTIVEVKETLFGERKEFLCTLVAQTPGEAVMLYRVPSEVRVGTSAEVLTLPAGTLTLGYFWTTRAYNVYHWLSPGGDTLGVYFNISEKTRITSQKVRWRDLVVDILVFPDGRCIVLDEHELPTDLDGALRAKIEAVRDELVCGHATMCAEVEVRSAALLEVPRAGRSRPGRT